MSLIEIENKDLRSAVNDMFPDFERVYIDPHHGVVMMGSSTYYLITRQNGYHLTISRNYVPTREIIDNVDNDPEAEMFVHKTGIVAVRRARLSTLIRIIKENETRLAA